MRRQPVDDGEQSHLAAGPMYVSSNIVRDAANGLQHLLGNVLQWKGRSADPRSARELEFAGVTAKSGADGRERVARQVNDFRVLKSDTACDDKGAVRAWRRPL